MNWSDKIRYPLKLSVGNINDDPIPKSNELRTKILKKYDSTCAYCGCTYLKYLILTRIKKKIDTVCHVCFIITHINFGFNNEILLYYSEIPQLDIIKKSVEYINTNDSIPIPFEIDTNCKKIQISISELSNILKNKKNYINLTNYKIFFSQSFNKSFIDSNSSETFLFSNSDSESDNELDDEPDINTNKSINDMTFYNIPKEEEIIINDLFQ